MTTFRDHVVSTLAPYVGQAVADTCVRVTAISLGKTTDTLMADDYPVLENNVRRLLGPVAPSNVIADLLHTIERGS